MLLDRLRAFFCVASTALLLIVTFRATFAADDPMAPAAASDTLPKPTITVEGHGQLLNGVFPIHIPIGQIVNLKADKQGTSQQWVLDTYAYNKFAVKPTCGVGESASGKCCPRSPEIDPAGCVDLGTVELTAPSISFYFIQQGAHTVRYLYTRDGKIGSASVKFFVDGPTGLAIKHLSMGEVTIAPDGCEPRGTCTQITLGRYDTTPGLAEPVQQPGIDITVSAYQPLRPSGLPYRGKFLWAQTVDETISWQIAGHLQRCRFSGLDAVFPYVTPDSTLSSINPCTIGNNELNDTPYFPWTNNFGKVEMAARYFRAQDYVMWQAEVSGDEKSVPVIVGLIKWGFQGQGIFGAVTNSWVFGQAKLEPTTLHVAPGIMQWKSVDPAGKQWPNMCPAESAKSGNSAD